MTQQDKLLESLVDTVQRIQRTVDMIQTKLEGKLDEMEDPMELAKIANLLASAAKTAAAATEILQRTSDKGEKTSVTDFFESL